MTIGMDLGDKTSRYCVLERGRARWLRKAACATTTRKAMAQMFGADAALPDRDRSGNAFAVGEPAAEELGARGDRGQCAAGEVDQPASRKNDKLDAQMLARLARVDPQLLRPIRHRSEEAQNGSDDDSDAGGAGGGADRTGERGARADQGDGRAAAGLRCRPDGTWKAGGTAGGSAGNAEAIAWKKWNR